MKQFKRRLFILFTVVVMAVTAAVPSYADYYSKVGYSLASQIVTLYPKKDLFYGGKSKNKVILGIVDGQSKATNVKSSKHSVLSVKTTATKLIKDGEECIETTFIGTAKKAGTTTISYKVDGKTCKVKITVKKYVNPISYIKIGNTTLSRSSFKSSNYTLKYSKFANKTVKIRIKLASGWTSEGEPDGWIATGWMYKNGSGFTSPWPSKGKNIKIEGGKGFTFTVYAYNKKTKQSEEVNIFFK